MLSTLLDLINYTVILQQCELHVANVVVNTAKFASHSEPGLHLLVSFIL